MTRPIDLLRQGRKEELWQMCCGFIDLSLEQFMDIQKRLLLEQIELLKKCELGRKVMGGAMPETVEEFRQQVPLTTYADYCPELVERREDVLAAKPVMWMRTSGRSGEYPCKWVPITEPFTREFKKIAAGYAILALCNGRGDTSKVKEHLKLLFTVGPRPYTSGVIGYLVQEAIGSEFLPSPSKAEKMSFQERIEAGFEEALYRGFDGFGGLSIVLVAVGERFSQQSGKIDIHRLLSHPGAFLRVTKGVVKSRLAHRPMLPRDLWTVKGIVGSGTDGVVFKRKIEELWGRRPLEAYISTEGAICAMQAWDYEGMTFIPNLNFFEFIPEREWFKWQLDRSYQPKTVLLNEVKAGENYEIVITNLHGGALVRYRVGDIVKITSVRNEKLNIDIPQMIFERRADDLIDVGLMRLTERVIWQAIENTGIPYVDWTACKEVIGERIVLRLYLELKENYIASEQGVAAAVYEQIKRLDDGFIHQDTEAILSLRPVEVTLLPQGSFSAYVSQRQAEGADLAHLKPPHINPPDRVLSLLGAPRVKVEAVPVTETEPAVVR